MYSLKEVETEPSVERAIEPLSNAELELRGKLGSDPIRANNRLIRRMKRNRELETGGVGLIAASPIAGALTWYYGLLPLGLSPSIASFALSAAGTAAAIWVLGSPLLNRLARHGRNLQGVWNRWVIEDLKRSSGIELTASELSALNYPSTPMDGDRVFGSVDRLIPGGGGVRMTLISKDGELRLLKSMISAPEPLI